MIILAATIQEVAYSTPIEEDGTTSREQDNQCPDWLRPNNTQPCECITDILQCNNSTQEASILDCYCITTSDTEPPHGIELGQCLYNCKPALSGTDEVYKELPGNVSKLDSKFCDEFNRKGRLCGGCRHNYSPPIYSYSLKCLKCNGQSQWLLYITVAFVPLTLFFILVVCLRISATSPQMNGYVIFAQVLTTPPNLRVITLALVKRNTISVLTSTLASLYGIWNLDFFRMFYPGICLHVSSLEALALDYIVAVYPLMLTIICYAVLKWNACEFKFISRLWKPFRLCSARVRGHIKAKTSLVDAFATFLLLSYIRLISVSFDLLVPVRVFNASGHKLGMYLYYDANIEYFGKHHQPYAITALIVSFLLIILPLMLLMAFPTRCFQKILGSTGIRFQGLRIFMDSFQGCYKDGTDGTRDCRYFPALYLLTRILLFVAYGLTLNQAFYGIVSATFVILGVLIVIAQPYKQHLAKFNTVEAVHMFFVALWFLAISCVSIATLKSKRYINQVLAFLAIVAVLPVLYITFVGLKWLLTREILARALRRLRPILSDRIEYEEIEGENSFLEGVDQRIELGKPVN